MIVESDGQMQLVASSEIVNVSKHSLQLVTFEHILQLSKH